MEKIEFPSHPQLRKRWKTLLVVLVVSLASFSVGVYANRVVIQSIQSLAGNHVIVPAPELQIINSIWDIQQNASLINGVFLNITTVGPAGAVPGVKLYQVFLQVSCLSGGQVFTCSTGTATIVLPTNMNGNSTVLPVTITPPVEPELTEVDDLSFIVSATPVSTPGFTVITVPSTVVLNASAMGTVHFDIMSINGFSGPVSLDLRPATPGVTITPSSKNVTLTASGTAVDPLVFAFGFSPGVHVICVGPLIAPGVRGPPCFFVILPFCNPQFSLTASPTSLLELDGFFQNSTGNFANNQASVTKTLTSFCGYSGTIHLSTSVSSAPIDGLSLGPPPAISLAVNSVTLSPGEIVRIGETITAASGFGFYTITNTATDGIRTRAASVSMTSGLIT